MAVPGWVGPAVSIATSLLGDKNGGLMGRLQREAMRKQMAESDRQAGIETEMTNSLHNNAGLFDPHQALAQLYSNDFHNQGLEAGALGAGYAAAGFRPGDTPVGDSFTRIGEQHRQARDNMATTLPLQYFNDKMNAYNQIRRPDPGYLSSVANEAANYQQPSNGLPEALGQYLQWQASQKKPATTPLNTPPTTDYTRLPNTFPPYQSTTPKFDLSLGRG